MRKLNSSLITDFISESGSDNSSRTFFAFVPLEDMVCYAVAESFDSDSDINSAKLAVESVLAAFEQNPSFRNIKRYINYAHDQIKANSVKNKLETAIAVAVSDYTRIRFASCGNIKFFLLRNNTAFYKGVTQTYFDSISAESSNHQMNPSEKDNLLEYLGGNKRPNPYLSSKIDLPDDTTILFLTGTIWERVDDIEILDVYEDSKPDAFLSGIQELFLCSQLINPNIRSYSLVSVYVAKSFKEDTAKKKKRRKKIITLCVILLIIGIITAVTVLTIRAADRRLISEIESIDTEAASHSRTGKYQRAHENYTEAKKKADSINMRNRQMIDEKKELSEIIRQRLSVFDSLQKGDSLMEQGNYEQALAEYQSALDLAELNEELQISDYIKGKIDRALRYMEVFMLIYFGEMYNAYGQHTKALQQFSEADANVRILGDLALMQRLMTLSFETNEKIVETVEDSLIRHIKETAEKAIEDIEIAESVPEVVLMLNKALKSYELILSLHDALSIIGERYVLAQNDVRSIEGKIAALTRADQHIQNADLERGLGADALDAQSQLQHYRNAKISLDEAVKCYDEAGIKDTSNLYVAIRSETIQIENIIADIERQLEQPVTQAEEIDEQQSSE